MPIEDSELLAGLAFLECYAHPDYHPALRLAATACRGIRATRRLDEMRKGSAENLDLSVRSLHALRAMGLKTVADVEGFVEQDDASVLHAGKRHYFTKKCLREVRELLGSFGLNGARRNARPA